MSNNNILVIGIAGGTGSGKSTLTKQLVNHFGDQITVLKHDDYYKAHDERGRGRFLGLNSYS